MNSWKILAIIFMILFVVETIGIISIFSMGITIRNNKNICSSSCFDNNATSFLYDYSSRLCSCYNGNKEIIAQGIVR